MQPWTGSRPRTPQKQCLAWLRSSAPPGNQGIAGTGSGASCLWSDPACSGGRGCCSAEQLALAEAWQNEKVDDPAQVEKVNKITSKRISKLHIKIRAPLNVNLKLISTLILGLFTYISFMKAMLHSTKILMLARYDISLTTTPQFNRTV